MRLPSAARLDGQRRIDRHSPHHRPHIAALHLVDYRNEGITAISAAPKSYVLDAVNPKIHDENCARHGGRDAAATPWFTAADCACRPRFCLHHAMYHFDANELGKRVA